MGMGFWGSNAVKAEVCIRCPGCGDRFRILYVLLGAPVCCVSCGVTFLSEAGMDTSFPATGYEMTFGDFKNLASDDLGSASECLKELEQYTVRLESGRVAYRNSQGELVDPLMIHLKIQSDPDMQLQIFRLGQSLWRF